MIVPQSMVLGPVTLFLDSDLQSAWLMRDSGWPPNLPPKHRIQHPLPANCKHAFRMRSKLVFHAFRMWIKLSPMYRDDQVACKVEKFYEDTPFQWLTRPTVSAQRAKHPAKTQSISENQNGICQSKLFEEKRLQPGDGTQSISEIKMESVTANNQRKKVAAWKWWLNQLQWSEGYWPPKMHTNVAVLRCAKSANLHSKGRDVMRKGIFSQRFQTRLSRPIYRSVCGLLTAISIVMLFLVHPQNRFFSTRQSILDMTIAMECVKYGRNFSRMSLVPNLQRQYHERIRKGT